MKRLYYSSNQHFTHNHMWVHMLLQTNVFVTAGWLLQENWINASLPNTDLTCHWRLSLCMQVERVSPSLNHPYLSPCIYSTILCWNYFTPKWRVWRHVPFFRNTERTFHFCLCEMTFSWISWWLIQPWRRGKWSINMQPFSRGWVSILL